MTPRILLVEDSPTMATAVLYFLKVKGYSSVVHASGTDIADKLLRLQKFDLVICDNHLGEHQPRGVDLFEIHRAEYAYRWIIFTAQPELVVQTPGMFIVDKMNSNQLIHLIEECTEAIPA